ncbi:Nif3-like dinuclear metal center hexameric protein [Psychroflexus maritimus]|uniref:GTP cyclohydrolase 1 type 2 homolog n=1 Tax=Psychroflexus maritimus TaxID=2714865 RepID=A0A967AH54_9FLAO|nr:Nif3-like dinuclear metal center hexameric protein [Psychroflexus maritimus]NGZ89310.1 Nif3-like dinuclear metal center hexameric protein [Psychroflexus maritimus]
MKVKDVSRIIEELAPLSLAEDFDNVGLLVGKAEAEVNGILITLDCLESVVDEAIKKKCNLILTFHPIIFSGLKKLTGKNYVERVVIKAIQHQINIYAIHTALDNVHKGVNHEICNRIGLKKQQILIPKHKQIKKLVIHVPKSHTSQLQEALFQAGAGTIGNYDECSFSIEGQGSFKGNSDSNPNLGEKGKREIVQEHQLNFTFEPHKQHQILQAMKKAHPYEEVAYEVSTLENTHPQRGMGMLGEFEKPMNELDFLNHLKTSFNLHVIRHSGLLDKPIKRVAVLGGSGAFAINDAINHKADAYVSSDFKYHDFYKSENQILMLDIGHYESEQYTKPLISAYLTKKIINFAPALENAKVLISEVNTNPVQYF